MFSHAKIYLFWVWGEDLLLEEKKKGLDCGLNNESHAE